MEFEMNEIDRLTEGLGDLYVVTGEDWELTISQMLTEPVVPTAIIAPEGWNISRYRVDLSSIHEGIKAAVGLVQSEILDRKIVGSLCPFTDSDDGIFAKWLSERAAGSDARLPDLPPDPLPREFEWLLDGMMQNRRPRRSMLNEDDDWLVGFLSSNLRHAPVWQNRRFDHDAAHKMIRERLPAWRARWSAQPTAGSPDPSA